MFNLTIFTVYGHKIAKEKYLGFDQTFANIKHIQIKNLCKPNLRKLAFEVTIVVWLSNIFTTKLLYFIKIHFVIKGQHKNPLHLHISYHLENF